tara:strand:- start:1525 stop:1806 length:282 start_codon:yes stop_codon:yes gene_type:complete
MVTEVDILALIAEVEEGDPVLQVANLVANRNPVGRTENAVLKGFVKDGNFFEHFGLSHNFFSFELSLTYEYNVTHKPRKSKKNFQLFFCPILS